MWFACMQFQMNERKAKTHRKVSVFKITKSGSLNSITKKDNKPFICEMPQGK